MSENDWDGWKKLTERIGGRCQLVGDDLFVTNVDFLSKGIAMGCANSILIKVNQIGSLSETLDAIEMLIAMVIRRLLPTVRERREDATIADIAVATNRRPNQDRFFEPFRPYGQIQPVAPVSRKSWGIWLCMVISASSETLRIVIE